MDPRLLTYYEAIERASADMLNAARAGNWDEVVKLEGACVLLISQLKHAAQEPKPVLAAELAQARQAAVAGTDAEADSEAMAFGDEALGHRHGHGHGHGHAGTSDAKPIAANEAARAKARIMQRILVNDAEIRQLAEPWLQTLDEALEGRRRTLH